jgi:hypothetical protein
VILERFGQIRFKVERQLAVASSAVVCPNHYGQGRG